MRVCHAVGVKAIYIEAARAAWERAASDLGIDVITTGAFLQHGAERVEVVALIPDFGGEKGTVIMGQQHSAAQALAKAQGFFPSIISPSYETYDRNLFENTLNDLAVVRRWRTRLPGTRAQPGANPSDR